MYNPFEYEEVEDVPFVKCQKCGTSYREFEMKGSLCKYCAGVYKNPCESCPGEDCACCGYGRGY